MLVNKIEISEVALWIHSLFLLITFSYLFLLFSSYYSYLLPPSHIILGTVSKKDYVTGWKERRENDKNKYDEEGEGD